jgi:hypothetical protein
MIRVSLQGNTNKADESEECRNCGAAFNRCLESRRVWENLSQIRQTGGYHRGIDLLGSKSNHLVDRIFFAIEFLFFFRFSSFWFDSGI